MNEELNERQKRAKERWIKERYEWNEEGLGPLARLAPDYMEAHIDMSSIPWKTGVLPPKVKEFIYIAIDSSVNTLYETGMRIHIGNALKQGATKEELAEVLELTSILSVHSCLSGLPILEEELKKTGVEVSEELNDGQKQLKERWVREKHYWKEELPETFLRLAPQYMEAHMNLSAIPWKKGVLPPKVKEFIYIAINAATTNLYEPGVRQHIKNALKLGATKAELVEVFELISGLGVLTCTTGMRILEEQLKKAGKI